MYGYIFETKNLKTGETYIGKRYAVNFDKKYLGEENNTALAVAIEKYGRPSFEVKMLMPYEDKKYLDLAYDEMAKVAPKSKKAEAPVEVPEVTDDVEVKEDPKPAKKGRKKKVAEDE